jgi:hypothetical protein
MKNSCSTFVALALSGTLLLAFSPLAPAQSSSKLSPLIRNPSASALGPTQRLNHERIDLSTITREDRDMLQGTEQRMGESVTTVRRFREGATKETVTPTRPQVDLDREKVRRDVAIFDD